MLEEDAELEVDQAAAVWDDEVLDSELDDSEELLEAASLILALDEAGEDEDSEELEIDPILLALALGDADEDEDSVELAIAEELELDPTLDKLDG